MSEEDPEWNILLSGGVEKGPYSLESLRGVHDISSTSSHYIKVWKEGQSKDTAITLPDALILLSQKKRGGYVHNFIMDRKTKLVKGDRDAESLSLISHF